MLLPGTHLLAPSALCPTLLTQDASRILYPSLHGEPLRKCNFWGIPGIRGLTFVPFLGRELPEGKYTFRYTFTRPGAWHRLLSSVTHTWSHAVTEDICPEEGKKENQFRWLFLSRFSQDALGQQSRAGKCPQVCEVPMAPVTNHHKCGGLKQHPFLSHLSGGRKSKTSVPELKSGCDKLVPWGGCGENPFLGFSASAGRLPSSAPDPLPQTRPVSTWSP